MLARPSKRDERWREKKGEGDEKKGVKVQGLVEEEQGDCLKEEGGRKGGKER